MVETEESFYGDFIHFFLFIGKKMMKNSSIYFFAACLFAIVGMALMVFALPAQPNVDGIRAEPLTTSGVNFT